MKIGYARVSIDDQEIHLQIDALKQAKCGHIYQEKASGAKVDRPELMKLLDNARKGDRRDCLEAGQAGPFHPATARYHGFAE